MIVQDLIESARLCSHGVYSRRRLCHALALAQGGGGEGHEMVGRAILAHGPVARSAAAAIQAEHVVICAVGLNQAVEIAEDDARLDPRIDAYMIVVVGMEFLMQIGAIGMHGEDGRF